MTTLIAFPKVVSVERRYRNQFGQERVIKPNTTTFLGITIPEEFVERRKTRGEIDNWHVVVTFYLGWRCVEFSGERAERIYKAYSGWLLEK